VRILFEKYLKDWDIVCENKKENQIIKKFIALKIRK